MSDKVKVSASLTKYFSWDYFKVFVNEEWNNGDLVHAPDTFCDRATHELWLSIVQYISYWNDDLRLLHPVSMVKSGQTVRQQIDTILAITRLKQLEHDRVTCAKVSELNNPDKALDIIRKEFGNLSDSYPAVQLAVIDNERQEIDKINDQINSMCKLVERLEDDHLRRIGVLIAITNQMRFP